jgi:phosphate transport system permease protein
MRTTQEQPAKHSKLRGDPVFKTVVVIVASSLVILTLLYFYELVTGAWPTLRLGTSFITGSTWDPLRGVFGALPMLYGSLVTAAIGLVIGVPISLGVAIFISELSPQRLKFPIGFLVELLAAVPSVIYGLWGLFIFAPFLSSYVYPSLRTYLGFLPIFSGRIFGVSIMTAGIVLAIMIIPIVSSISRDALLAVPSSQREAAYALGATKSEAVNSSVLSYARSGIIAAIFLGFGRAFGETMAVTFLIGNSPVIPSSLLAPGYTLASLIANEFTEATTTAYRAGLIEAGLVLLIVSFASTFLGRLLIRRLVKSREAATYL